MASLDARCQRTERRVVVEGSLTKSSATYVEPLALIIAEVLGEGISRKIKARQELEAGDVRGLERQLTNGIMKTWGL